MTKNYNKPLVTLLTLAAAWLVSPAAHAKNVGTYRAIITSENEMGGRWSDLGLVALGWDCHGSTQVTFNEQLRDHRGVLRTVPQQVDGNWSFSVFMANQPVITQFRRNMDVPNPNLGITLRETCTKTVATTRIVNEEYTDSQGNRRTRPVPRTTYDTQEAWMSWACNVDRIPNSVHDEVVTTCAPSNSYFGTFGLESLLVNMFRQKTFTARVELRGVQEQYAQNFCERSQDQSNRVVLHFTQGVGGHTGEDDFVFHVNIDGRHQFDLRSRNGILDEEVAYCGASDRVTVDVTATEEDVMFNDEYVSRGPVTLDREAPTNWGRVRLERGTYFGQAFTDRTHYVMVALHNRPRR